MRFEVETSLYGPAPLLNEFKGIMHDFEVTRDKLSSIISDADIKEYQDGGITMASKLSSVVQDINGVHQQFSEFETDYDNTKQQYTSLTSKVNTIETDVNGTKQSISQVKATADQAATDITTINASINGINTNVSSIRTTMTNDYATKTYADDVGSDAVSAAAEDAQSKADKALADAKKDTIDRLKSYSTTVEMNSAISQSARDIKLEVSSTYATQTNLDNAKKATIVSDTMHYLATNASSGVTTSTSGWTTTAQAVTLAKRYLWTYHTYTYGDNSTKNTSPVITGVWGNTGEQGQKGDKGDTGNKGDTGTGITTVTTLYYASSSASAPSAPTSKVTTTSTSTGIWTKGIPTLTGTYKYLYTCDQVEYDNNTTNWTTVVRDNATTDLQTRLSAAELKITSDAIVGTVKSSDEFGSFMESTIEQKADSIRLKASTIAWSATNSSMTSAGVLTCTGANINGDLTIETAGYGTGGKIIAKEGHFDVVDNSGYLNNIVSSQTLYGLRIYSENNTRNESLLLSPANKTAVSSKTTSAILASGNLAIVSNSANASGFSGIKMYAADFRYGAQNSSYKGFMVIHDSSMITANYGTGSGSITAYRVTGGNSAVTFNVNGQITASGSKSRVVDTENYGNRLLYCYEMPSPMFGDIGCAQTDENGEAIIDIDDLFHETVSTSIEYQVFLQKEGNGDLYVKQKERAYFIVEGTPNLKFSWEVKVKQAGYEYERLDDMDFRDDVDQELNQSTDYFDIYKDEFEYIQEQEAILYEAA